MKEVPIYLPDGAGRVLICIDDAANGELQGRWYNPYCEGASAFAGVIPLLFELEQLHDALRFPQSTVSLRSIGKRKSGAPPKKQRKEVKRYMSDAIFEQEHGEKATFIVQVQFRQNATWQGTVTWTEKNQTCHFRSALELLKMMDETMEGTAQENESPA